MSTPRAVLAALQRTDAGRPRITHYDASGRVELSGRVLANWVAKAANLLQDELDVTVSSTVGLDLPATHWRSAYWALAAWTVGATVAVGDAALGAVDARVTATPGHARAGDVLVTLTALARAHPGPLPAGVVDEAATLATHGDVVEPWDTPGPEAIALTDGVTAWTYADAVPADAAPDRRLVPAVPDSAAAPLRLLLGTWAADGSVVVAPADGELDRLALTERVTRR